MTFPLKQQQSKTLNNLVKLLQFSVSETSSRMNKIMLITSQLEELVESFSQEDTQEALLWEVLPDELNIKDFVGDRNKVDKTHMKLINESHIKKKIILERLVTFLTLSLVYVSVELSQ